MEIISVHFEVSTKDTTFGVKVGLGKGTSDMKEQMLKALNMDYFKKFILESLGIEGSIEEITEERYNELYEENAMEVEDYD